MSDEALEEMKRIREQLKHLNGKWLIVSIMELLDKLIAQQEAEQGEVDEKIALIKEAESVLTTADRSNAWREERDRVLERLRLFLLEHHWSENATPERAKYLRKQPQPRSEQPTTIDDLLRDMRCEVEYTHVATMPIPLYERMKAVIKGKPPAMKGDA